MLCCAVLQNTLRWLEKDKQLLAMTDSVDYDVEGSLCPHVNCLTLRRYCNHVTQSCMTYVCMYVRNQCLIQALVSASVQCTYVLVILTPASK